MSGAGLDDTIITLTECVTRAGSAMYHMQQYRDTGKQAHLEQARTHARALWHMSGSVQEWLRDQSALEYII